MNRRRDLSKKTRLFLERLEDKTLMSVLSVGPNLNISPQHGNHAESTISINPTNPLNLFAGSTVGNVNKYSMDGGVTWQNSQYINLPGTIGDIQSAWDSFGNLFITYLSSSSFGTIVARSSDGGATFRDGRTIAASGTDQPSIAVGPSGLPDVPGAVWVTYTGGGSAVFAAGAPVMGLDSVGAFTAPLTVPGPGGDFGDIAVGPSGQVLVTYQNNGSGVGPDTIKVNLNPTGLASPAFHPVVIATDTNVGGFAPIPAQPLRTIDAEANLAWDKSGGPYNGRVYLVYTDRPSVSSNATTIYVRYSDDNGMTWSPRVQVNDDPQSDGKSHFNDAISVDQTSGKVAVTWYDTRDSGPANNFAEVWGTVSDDGGVDFLPNVKISAGMSDAVRVDNGFDFGDYDKMDFYNGVFYRTWADNSNSTGDNPDGTNALDIYTAAVSVGSPAGPAVINSVPRGNVTGAVDHIRVTFDESVRPNSFSINKIGTAIPSFRDPNGNQIPIVSITPVAGSNNTQFDVAFPQQTQAGTYTMVIGPKVRDRSGHQMDQDNDGVTGQPDDAFTGTFTIEGARITNFVRSGLPTDPPSNVRVTFNEPVDPNSFDPSQVTSFTDPNGNAVTVDSVTPVSGSNNTQFDIGFAAQTVVGTYSMTIGPNILDFFGNPMPVAFTGTFIYTDNLITNPGFETGNFMGWTQSGNTQSTSVSNDHPHTGTYAADLGPAGSLGFLSQTVPTTPGQTYTLDYWLDHPYDNSVPNEFKVTVGGTVIYDQTNLGNFSYTEFTFSYTATDTMTTVQFGFREDPAYFYLDDVYFGTNHPTTGQAGGSENVSSVASSILRGAALVPLAPKQTPSAAELDQTGIVAALPRQAVAVDGAFLFTPANVTVYPTSAARRHDSAGVLDWADAWAGLAGEEGVSF
jgi:hypothetical protein